MNDLQTTAEMMKGPLGDLLHKLVAPLSQEIGESLGVWAKHYRFKNGLKMLQKTQSMLAKAGIEPHAVNPRLFLPIIECASVEDDDDMQSRWAALLANAATTMKSVHPSYIEILKQLSPEDARLLDQLCDFCNGKRDREVTAWMRPVTVVERERRIASGDNPEVPFENLIRLGLVQYTQEFDSGRLKVEFSKETDARIRGDMNDYHFLSDIAVSFVIACRAPKTVNAEK